MSGLRRRTRLLAAGAVSAAVLGGALLRAPGAASIGALPLGCGRTTLEATIVIRDDGTLACGPGQDLVVREDLARAKASRAQTRSAALAFLAFGDTHLLDEESPLRAEFADLCGEAPLRGSFRPHEALLPHLLDAHLRAASALAGDPQGSPVVAAPYSFAVQLGNGVDNAQRNELGLLEGLFGGGLVEPDTGADGYEGVQSKDPRGARGAIGSPSDASIRDLANEPFLAGGLRGLGGAPLPWLGLTGDHDVRTQGLAPDADAWRAFAAAWATGSVKLNDLAPDQRQAVCDDPALLSDPRFWNELAAQPGTARTVAADPARAPLTRDDLGAALWARTGAPARVCADADGVPLARACGSWDHGDFHIVVLDTTSAAGTQGAIDSAQLAWLERDLRANSARYYDASGARRSTKNTDRLTIVLTHHASSAMTARTAGDDLRSEADLDALLLRFPNVILRLSADAYRNEVRPHRDAQLGTGYWEIVAPSIADWPSQTRSIEIADNHDGTLSIVGLLVDAAAPANPRSIDWSADPTPEDRAGAARSINETWLASAAREAAAHDPQRPKGAAGSPEDRNVELLLRHPWGVTTRTTTAPPVQPLPGTAPSFGGFPGTFPGGFPGFPGGQPGSGFPGSFPPGTQFPGQAQPPETPPYGGYAMGGAETAAPLATDPATGNAMARRAATMLALALGGAWWLFRARVRRWMVGL